MKIKLIDYKVSLGCNVLEIMKKIDKNAKGFVVVVDNNEAVCGVITDGDIRRKFIQGGQINLSAKEIYGEKFEFLEITDDIAAATQIFKSKIINFLPILDYKKRLINILTKKQMQAMLLQDIKADLSYDFSVLDENVVNHEIYQRPWGFYKTTVMNEYFQSKVISVNPHSQLSLQSHNHREEHWIVAYGIGSVQIEQSVLEVKSGSVLFIPKGCKHRLINTDAEKSLIITEIQIGDYFGEDDIIRYDDIYGRV